MRLLLLLLALVVPCGFVQAEKKGTREGSPSVTVDPGECHTNKDGVTVCTDEDSKNAAVITPSRGTSKSITKVTTETRWDGSINGIDEKDVVKLMSRNTATVTGTGGSVKVGGCSSVTVINNGTASTPINVTLPSGASAQVWPGGAVTFLTS